MHRKQVETHRRDEIGTGGYINILGISAIVHRLICGLVQAYLATSRFGILDEFGLAVGIKSSVSLVWISVSWGHTREWRPSGDTAISDLVACKALYRNSGAFRGVSKRVKGSFVDFLSLWYA